MGSPRFCPHPPYVYAVNLLDYTEVMPGNLLIYWTMFIALIIVGIINIVLMKYEPEKNTDTVSYISIVINILAVMFLIISRQTYASILIFVILVIKMMLLFKKKELYNNTQNT